ncbi:MAG: radical SAM protein [Candidatus Aenigmatarchaeota archaeon]
MESVIERLCNWYEGIKSPPEAVQIYPTNSCNLSCIFCVQRAHLYNPKEEISTKRLLEVTREICEMGVKKFLISGGGEPLLSPSKTLGIMKIIKSYGGEGCIITNNTCWKSSHLKMLIKIKWDKVMISLHGSTPETHNFLTGCNKAFTKLLKNLKLLNSYKKKFGSNFPLTEFTFVLNKLNYKEVPEIISLAYELGVKGVNLEPLCINNKEAESIKLSKDERRLFFKEILPRAEKLANKFNINTNFQQLKKVKFIEKAGKLKAEILKHCENKEHPFLSSPCYEPWLWPKIEANGELWPCSTVHFKTTNIKDKSFKEIWYGTEFENFRKRILKRELPEECQNCVLTHIPLQMELRKRLKENIIKKLIHKRQNVF